MIWAFAAYIGHVMEMLMITEVIRSMNPLIYMGLFYFFSSIFIILYNLYLKTSRGFVDWHQVLAHKKLIIGFISGAFFGNALWFGSLFLIGIGLTSFLLIFIRIIVTVYSYVYMNDRYPFDKAVSFSISVLALMLFSFEVGEVNLLGVSAAVLSCIGFSIETICRKKLAECDVRPENTVFLRNIGLFVLSWVGIFIAASVEFVDLKDLYLLDKASWGLIICAAFLGGVVVNLMIFFALKTLKLSFLEALATTKPIVLAFCGVLLFDETLTVLQAIYGGVIVLSVVYFIVPYSFAKRRE